MSIHNFSKAAFVEVAKDILLHDTFIGVRNADKINETASFHDVLNINSLDVAELIVSLEEKYHVDMEWANVANIDSIEDVYEVFVKTLARMRQPKITSQQIQR